MKVAKYYSRLDIRLEEMPVPQIGPGEILVQVKAFDRRVDCVVVI